MTSDLTAYEIRILESCNRYGEMNKSVRNYSRLEDHPLAQWAYDLGQRCAADGVAW